MNALLRTSSIAVLALVAAGCTPVPIVLKDNDIPSGFVGPVTPGAQVWPSTDWWKGFNSDEMNGLIASAQTNNLDLAAAAARVLEADAQTDIAGSALFPSIDLGGNAQRTGKKTGPGHTTFGASLNASYQLDLWGLAQSNLRAANETLKASHFAQQIVALTVTANTANTYFDVLALRERVSISKANIAAAERVLAITEAKVTNGVSSRLDLAQQQALLSGQKAQIPALEQQEREARYALALLLARLPEGFDVNAQNLDGIAAPVVAPGIPSELLRRRPDVAQAEADLAAAHANVDAARAAFFPIINLTTSGGVTSAALSTLFKSSSFGYTLGASLLQTIFDGGRLIGESRQARARQEELIANYRKAVLNAFSDVEIALGQVSSLAEQDRLTTEQVNAAAEAFRISEIQYREGVADLLTVLQSQQTLFTAQDRLVQIKLARIQAIVGLHNALGGGWSENPDDATQKIPQSAATTTAPTSAVPAPTPSPVAPVPATPGPEQTPPENQKPQH
ncbi:MAG: TolC family protein [Proteobacteria bacterium]|nr:TolC family protein [Pseudomonadota bacterium]